MAVGGYDGMHLIYEALKKTGGKADGDALIAAMKGLAWESPRGPISIDPETRDIVQNIYIRKVEKVDGELYNVEFPAGKKIELIVKDDGGVPDNTKRLAQELIVNDKVAGRRLRRHPGALGDRAARRPRARTPAS